MSMGSGKPAFEAKIGRYQTRSKKNGYVYINPFLFLGVVGTALCFSWFFAVLLSPDFSCSGLAGSVLRLGHVAFIVALSVSYFAIRCAGNYLQNHREAFIAVTLLCGLVAMAPYLNEYQDVQLLLKSALAGVCAASLTSLWAEFLCVHSRGEVRIALATSLAVAFFVFVVALVTEVLFAWFFMAVSLLASFGIYLYLRAAFAPMDSIPFVDAKESDSRAKISWRSFLLTAMGSLAQGFAVFYLVDLGWSSLNGIIVWALSLMVAALLLLDSFGSFFLREMSVRRLFLPVLAACMLTLIFIPRKYFFIPCLLAFSFSLLPYSNALFATCEHIVFSNLSPLRAFAWARLAAAIGLLIGFLAGWVTFSSEVFGESTLKAFATILTTVFTLIFSIVDAKSYYPRENIKRQPPRLIVDDDKKDDPVESTDAEKKASVMAPARRIDTIEVKCELLARKYNLTDRQKEVFRLLAKGRSPSFIQKQLYISRHTAKAHVYAIYKKLGVHSKQELLDLVESFKLGE